MESVSLGLVVLGVYLALGVPSAIAFLAVGVKRVDGNPMNWGARLLLFPGCCALWPVLLAKWFGGKGSS